MLPVVVFLSGAVVMILELIASRVLAPYLGTSLYVWTSLIGMILLSLSLGYWWGGKLADRRPDPRTLSLILLAAAAAVALIPLLQAPVLAYFTTGIQDLRWRSVAGAALFATPSALLGMVSPFAARLAMGPLAHSGRTVGRLYALSTLGSIAGTFAAGFWLIPAAGSTRLLLILALMLLGNSLLCAPRGLVRRRAAVLLVWTWAATHAGDTPVLAAGRIVADRDTAYQRLLVFDLPVENRQPVRVLSMGFEEYHSAMLLDAPEELPLPYTRFFRLGPALRPGRQRALVIGGGAFSYPLDLLRACPEAAVDVVELDPGVSRAASEYFGFKGHPHLKLYHEDGRVFLNRPGAAYDAVFLDVFWGRTIPFHLATLESARRLAARLAPEGLLLVNFMSALEGPAGAFFRAEYATLRQVFPQVLVFPVFYPQAGGRVQNLVLVASRSAAPLQPPQGAAQRYWANLWRHPVPLDMPVLTDDWAPVEQFAARMIP